MASDARTFPPRKINDLDRRSASNFLALLKDHKAFPVTPVLGAGVSASAGLPQWSALLRRICEIFFYHWEFAIAHGSASTSRPPREMSIVFYEVFFRTDKTVAAAGVLAEQDTLLAAQQIKNCIREADWRYLLRKSLYRRDEFGNLDIKASGLLQSLADYCVSSELVRGVISYNWDNLFERQLKDSDVRIAPLWKSGQGFPQDSLPLYFPHGYLPLEGGPVSRIVLASSDYHQAATEVYSWANLVQVQAFCNSVVVFVGSSMVDPNIRRLLEISTAMAVASSYAFLPTSVDSDDLAIMSEALFDRELNRLGVKVIRFPVDKTQAEPYSRLPDLISLMSCDLMDENAVWSQ